MDRQTMQARWMVAAAFAFATTFPVAAGAGDWLGGQYWGQIAGCASCGGSMYGGILPPGAIWVGEIGSGGGPGCGCEACHGDVGPIIGEEELPLAPSPGYVLPVEPHSASAKPVRIEATSRRVSYVERVTPIAADSAPRVTTVKHISQPERLERAPIRIVSPDGRAGRMYR
jgi:hypothetical protein